MGDYGSLSLKRVSFCEGIFETPGRETVECAGQEVVSSGQLERQERQEKLLCGLDLGIQLLQEKSVKLKIGYGIRSGY